MRTPLRGRAFAPLWFWGLCAVAGACSSDYFIENPPGGDGSVGTGATGGSFPGSPGKGGSSGRAGKSARPAIDTRAVVAPEHQPPPVSGGTLLALRSGGYVVVADPDRDRLSFVDVKTRVLDGALELDVGAEPGRLVEGDGEVHVLLRGSGEVATVSLATRELISRRAVCKAPRGIVYDAAQQTLLVACLEGRLVELSASDGAILRDVASEPDLRDLVLSGGRLYVTRFRSAELLELDGELEVKARYTLPSNRDFIPAVAWRAVAGPDGSVVVVHQRGTTARIAIIDDDGEGAAGEAGGASQAGSSDEGGIAGEAGSAGETSHVPLGNTGYGSVDPCQGIVESGISVLKNDGSFTTTGRLVGAVLPVDIAVGPSGDVAVANAGVDELLGNSAAVQLLAQSQLDAAGVCTFSTEAEVRTPTLGAVFDAESGQLVVQTRQPAAVIVYDENFTPFEIRLGGVDVTETGHEIFHRDAGVGIACASCHPEGTDDGRVWNFSTVGARRTQPLDVKLEGSAPFHWDAEFDTIDSLLSDVLVGRMGGQLQTQERVAALERFLYQLEPRPGVRDPSDAAALRGKTLFESERTGCSECHQGSALSSFETALIGKGSPTQVPSLLGVSTRAPLMHDGCANTLRERFDPDCGGSKHGVYQDLAADELDDLVAYLETL